MLAKDEIIEALKKTEALEEGHFKLSSGLHSDKYVQCAKIFQYPWVASKLCKDLSQKITIGNIDKIAGPAMGGILPAYEMSKILSKPNVFSERDRKENDEMKFRRGFRIQPGEKILVVEDVITTGKSVQEIIEAIESNGGEVSLIASLIDRSQGKAGFDVPYVSLIELDINTYEPNICPLCAKNIPLIKPGSR